MKINPFLVAGAEKVSTPWNIHRLNLSRMPILDSKARKVDKWLNSHVGSMLSVRERSLRKKTQE
jgi:hypothetical protein